MRVTSQGERIVAGCGEEVGESHEIASLWVLLVFRILRSGAAEGVKAIGFSSEEELDMTMARLHEELWTDYRAVLVPIALEESIIETWRTEARLARRTVLDRIGALVRTIVQNDAQGRFGYKASYVPGRWVDEVVSRLIEERGVDGG